MSTKKVIWMCSGQGSQYFQMGKDLYEQDAVFRSSFDTCSRIAASMTGDSLTEILYRDAAKKADPFDNTLQTHPAICSIQYAMAQSLLKRGLRPDGVLGYSIGEVAANMIAGVLTLEEGLSILHLHARLMEAQSPPGGMLAVLASPDRIRPVLGNVQRAWIAGHNFDGHSVVTGGQDAIDLLFDELRSLQFTTVKLPVRRAFHSPLMDPLEEQFKTSLPPIPERIPKFEVISPQTGPPHPTAIHDSIWSATRQPVWFRDAIRKLEEQEQSGSIYLDLGPSGTLATFAKYNVDPKKGSEIYSSITPFGEAEKNLQIYRDAVHS